MEMTDFMFRGLFLFPEQGADGHNDRKYDQIPYTAHLVANNAGNDHKYRAAQRQNGHNKTPQNILILFLAHPLDEDGQVHQIDGDDGKLGGVEYERTGPGAGKVGKIEVNKPGSNDHQGQNGCVIGHIGPLIDLTVNIGRRAFPTGSQCVKTAGAGHHQSVCCA